MWFVEASVVAALAWPLVQRMGRHMPAWVAVLALTGAALVAVGVIGAAAFTELHEEAERFRDNVPAAVRELQDDKPFGGILEDLKVADQMDRLSASLSERFQIGKDLPGLATALGGKVSTGFIIWVLSVMLVFTGPGMVRASVRALPGRSAGRVGPALEAAYGDSIRYLGLTSLRALVVGAVVYVTASALGIDMPTLLATIAFICAFIPFVGLAAGALPLALLAILNGTTEALVIAVVAIAAQAVDSLVVQPRIHRRSTEFGLFLTLVVTIIGFGLYGVTGLFLGLVGGVLVLALLQRLDRTPDTDGSDAIDPDGTATGSAVTDAAGAPAAT